jgi:RNA-directed DNA polymerase|uniref:hypothetical protein n=1 Tax=Cryptomonas gyropyrenoidosa TaxID=233257 RepID=UPI0027A6CB48|nr:hypothetical protein QLP26_pgp052 [Cryptomonas gyropyrenoidosa]WFQ83030.1 hypothetical protein [Cryptomonas gyropyrenoidosa]
MEKTPKSKEGWEFNNIKLIKTHIRKLQKRIYLASKYNDLKIVRKLQHTLLKSYHARILVIQDLYYKNKKKKIRKIVFKYNFTRKSSLKRAIILIKKSSEFKQNNILTCKSVPKLCLENKINQNIFLLMLVPEWKARFEKKLKKSLFHQALNSTAAHILFTINKKPKYMLKSFIQKNDQKLNISKLLVELGFYKGKIYKKLKSWLELESIQKEIFSSRVCNNLCLLLAHVLLYKMQFILQKSVFLSLYYSQKYGLMTDYSQVNFVYHGCEFVALHDNPTCIKEYKKNLDIWLGGIGLQLCKKYTYLGYTIGLNNFSSCKYKRDKEIFNFSVITIQQRIIKKSSIHRLLTLIKPSQKECLTHQKQLSLLIKRSVVSDQEALIYRLNFLIKKWIFKFANIPQVMMRETIVRMDYLLHLKLRRWSKNKTGTLNKGFKKYWNNTDKKLEFTTNYGVKLCTHKDCYRLKKSMEV